MAIVTLAYGTADPLVLEIDQGAALADLSGPEGVAGPAAGALVAAEVASPAAGPPLVAHVVPGDRVVVALAGDVPQAAAVAAAVVEQVIAAGADVADVAVLHAAGLVGLAGQGPVAGDVPGADEFDAAPDSATSYLMADAAGQPLYLARRLVDADVVVAVGGWAWNSSLGGRSPDGELWPAFSRHDCRREFVRALAARGRAALADWKTAMQEVSWQLGVCASLRLVAGRGGTLHAARFGLPDQAARAARTAASGWCPRVDEPVEFAVASLADPRAGFDAVIRAAAAAARVTQPGGTVCVAGRVAAAPGIVFLRWRQGAPLDRLVHEALASGDDALVADALQARLCARALGERRLVLLTDLDEATVEELGFGHAASPEVVERLAHRAESVAVLHEADRMLPNPAP